MLGLVQSGQEQTQSISSHPDGKRTIPSLFKKTEDVFRTLSGQDPMVRGDGRMVPDKRGDPVRLEGKTFSPYLSFVRARSGKAPRNRFSVGVERQSSCSIVGRFPRPPGLETSKGDRMGQRNSSLWPRIWPRSFRTFSPFSIIIK